MTSLAANRGARSLLRNPGRARPPSSPPGRWSCDCARPRGQESAPPERAEMKKKKTLIKITCRGKGGKERGVDGGRAPGGDVSAERGVDGLSRGASGRRLGQPGAGAGPVLATASRGEAEAEAGWDEGGLRRRRGPRMSRSGRAVGKALAERLAASPRRVALR